MQQMGAAVVSGGILPPVYVNLGGNLLT